MTGHGKKLICIFSLPLLLASVFLLARPYSVSASTLNIVWNRLSGLGGGDKFGQGIVVAPSGNAVYMTGYSWNGVNYDFRTMKFD